MSRAVEYLDASSHHNIVADGDLTPDRESAIVPDGHVVADSKRGVSVYRIANMKLHLPSMVTLSPRIRRPLP